MGRELIFARCSLLIAVGVATAGVRDATAWTSPVNVSNMPSGSRAFGPEAACDSFGNLHLLWAGGVDPASNWHIWYQSYTGSSWSAAGPLSTPGANRPDIAVDGGNNLHVCYEDDAEDDVWYRRWTSSGWSTPANVSSHSGVSDDISPSLAIDAYNRLYVAWHDYSNVFFSSRPGLSSPWCARQTIVSGQYSTGDPDIVVDGSGNARVFWQCRPIQDSNWNIYYSAQSNPPPGPHGTVSGVVRNQYGTGVSGAMVTVAVAYVAVSGAGGTYSVLVPPGTHSGTASKQYYLPQTADSIVVVQDQTTAVDFTITGQPPAPVSLFAVASGNQFNDLNWTNPASGNFTATMIRFSTSAYPVTPSDGTLLLDEAGSPGGTGGFQHSGLTNGTTYYYTAFSYYSDFGRYYASGTTVGGTPAGPADFDRDGDVNSSDFGFFQRCFGGDFVPQTDPACAGAKFDVDEDVDQQDFAAFMGCLQGPGVPADPNCAPIN